MGGRQAGSEMLESQSRLYAGRTVQAVFHLQWKSSACWGWLDSEIEVQGCSGVLCKAEATADSSGASHSAVIQFGWFLYPLVFRNRLNISCLWSLALAHPRNGVWRTSAVCQQKWTICSSYGCIVCVFSLLCEGIPWDYFNEIIVSFTCNCS